MHSLFRAARRSWLTACLSVVGFTSSAAEVYSVNPKETEFYWSHIRLMIEGPIRSGDAAKVERLIVSANARALNRSYSSDPTEEHQPVVGIDSQGGDVAEAMKIGRLLREQNATLLVRSEGRCESACVLVLAGASTKFPGAKLGIHRIRPVGERFLQMSAAQATREYNLMRMRIEGYLREMGVSSHLADMMFRTGSEDMLYLTYSEASDLGLVGMDPGFAEYVRARKIHKYGKQCVAKEDAMLTCLRSGRGDDACRRETGFRNYPCL